MLKISFNLSLDIGHKHSGFSKILSEKSFKFFPSKGGGLVALNLSFMLLATKVHLVPGEQGRKRNMLRFCHTGYVKMAFTLLIEIVALQVETTIV